MTQPDPLADARWVNDVIEAARVCVRDRDTPKLQTGLDKLGELLRDATKDEG